MSNETIRILLFCGIMFGAILKIIGLYLLLKKKE